MNKKYYVAPVMDVIDIQTENTLLSGSIGGFDNKLTEDEGDQELTNKKGGFGGCIWMDEY